MISPLVVESRFPVGSSASTMLGRFTRARAMATRWRSPPESSLGRWPSAIRQSQLRHHRLGQRPALPLRHPGVHQGQLDVLKRRGTGQEVEGLKYEADLAVADPCELGLVELGDGLAGQPVLASAGRVEAADQIHERRFARTRRARDGDELVAADGEVHSAQGVNHLAPQAIVMPHAADLDQGIPRALRRR